MIDLQTVSITIAAAGLLIGVTYNMLILRNNERGRKASLFMNLYGTYSSQKVLEYSLEVGQHWIWKDLEDFEKKYGEPSSFSKWVAVLNYFEGIGVLVKKGFIDYGLVNDLLGSQIVLYWEKFAPLIKEQRERWSSATIAENWEILYKEIVKRRKNTSGLLTNLKVH